jgi:hypothetical protein
LRHKPRLPTPAFKGHLLRSITVTTQYTGRGAVKKITTPRDRKKLKGQALDEVHLHGPNIAHI